MKGALLVAGTAAIQIETLGKRSRVVVAERAGDLDAWSLRAADGSP